MRIKGRYVATIEVDIDYDDDDELTEIELLPYDDAKFYFSGDTLKHEVADALLGYVFDKMPCKATINEQYKDLYSVPDGV